jgi:hypothetical protein
MKGIGKATMQKEVVEAKSRGGKKRAVAKALDIEQDTTR